MGLDMMLYKNGEDVMYWRKANAIHQWFVDNVQYGKDDCNEYGVSVDDMKQLLALVSSVLKTKDTSELSPVLGFFFGSTDVDEWYWKDLRRTKKELAAVIKGHKKGDIYTYQSSW